MPDQTAAPAPGPPQDPVAEARRTLLAEAGETLAASLDYATTLRAVAALAVRGFADACLVDILDEDGTPERLAVDHRDPRSASGWRSSSPTRSARSWTSSPTRR